MHTRKHITIVTYDITFMYNMLHYHTTYYKLTY